MIGVQSADADGVLEGLLNCSLLRLSRVFINENLCQQRRYLFSFTLQLGNALVVQSEAASGLGLRCSRCRRRRLRWADRTTAGRYMQVAVQRL
ncbi:hypothetical protein D3C85_1093890 [compost metagenome]